MTNYPNLLAWLADKNSQSKSSLGEPSYCDRGNHGFVPQVDAPFSVSVVVYYPTTLPGVAHSRDRRSSSICRSMNSSVASSIRSKVFRRLNLARLAAPRSFGESHCRLTGPISWSNRAPWNVQALLHDRTSGGDPGHGSGTEGFADGRRARSAECPGLLRRNAYFGWALFFTGNLEPHLRGRTCKSLVSGPSPCCSVRSGFASRILSVTREVEVPSRRESGSRPGC